MEKKEKKKKNERKKKKNQKSKYTDLKLQNTLIDVRTDNWVSIHGRRTTHLFIGRNM